MRWCFTTMKWPNTSGVVKELRLQDKAKDKHLKSEDKDKDL